MTPGITGRYVVVVCLDCEWTGRVRPGDKIGALRMQRWRHEVDNDHATVVARAGVPFNMSATHPNRPARGHGR